MVKNEPQKLWKKNVVVYSEAFSRHLDGGTHETKGKTSENAGVTCSQIVKGTASTCTLPCSVRQGAVSTLWMTFTTVSARRSFLITNQVAHLMSAWRAEMVLPRIAKYKIFQRIESIVPYKEKQECYPNWELTQKNSCLKAIILLQSYTARLVVTRLQPGWRRNSN